MARPPFILIVHGDPAARASAKHALELAGYNAVTAGDGLEALRVAASQRPDVVVTESSLPKLSGRELVRFLKSKPETAHIRIVIISRDGAERDHGDFRADEVLQGPSDIGAVRTAVANVLAR